MYSFLSRSGGETVITQWTLLVLFLNLEPALRTEDTLSAHGHTVKTDRDKPRTWFSRFKHFNTE